MKPYLNCLRFLLASKERQSPQNHITRRIRELCKLATEKPSKRGAPGVSRKESSRALSLVFLYRKLAFLAQEEAEAKESIITLVCVLVFENSKRNETFFAKKRNTTLLCCCCRSSSSSKKERVIGEREKVDEALFDFKRSSSIEYLV